MKAIYLPSHKQHWYEHTRKVGRPLWPLALNFIIYQILYNLAVGFEMAINFSVFNQ